MAIKLWAAELERPDGGAEGERGGRADEEPAPRPPSVPRRREHRAQRADGTCGRPVREWFRATGP